MTWTAPKLHLRRVTDADAELLYAWANDKVVRDSAFDSAPLQWQSHCEWLRKRLADQGCFIFIGFNDQHLPVGQIRFEQKKSAEFEVDVHTAPAARGCGYGAALIACGIQQLVKENPVDMVHAYVKATNRRSKQAFLRAGFAQLSDLPVHNQPCHHLIYRP